MAQSFKEGDVVQLKSGGPKMTIDGVAPQGKYYCVWFAGAKREFHSFSAETLTPWTESKAKNE
jgi:uncharacterized protein YodC (DUF2158 family)